MYQFTSVSSRRSLLRPLACVRRLGLCVVLVLVLGARVPPTVAMLRPTGIGVAVTSPLVSVVGSALKVRPADQPAGASSAQLIAAQNEFESFQIVVQAGPAALPGLVVTLAAPLTGPGGTIPAANITIYREAYYDVQQPSDQEGAPGAWPDALIPAVDPYYGEARTAFPIDVPAGENRVAWVDVLVPHGATPGVYAGAIAVSAQNLAVTVPVQLTVLNFALPSTARLTSAFGLGWNSVCQATYGHDCFQPPATEADGWRLNALYARAALDNRITISYPQYQPITSPGERALFEEYTLPLLNGTLSTHPELRPRLPSAKLTSLQVDTGAPLAAWAAEATSQGFADRAFVYACDEPGTNAAAWTTCTQQAQAAHTVWSAAPILVTASIQDATQFNATGEIDWLVTLVNQMDDKPGSPYAGNQRGNYDPFLQSDSRNRVWLYTSCMSHGCDPVPAHRTVCEATPPGSATNDPYFTGWPGYVIDAPASEARAMGWLSFQYNTSGELYFEVGHCLASAWTAQFAYGGNGDGTLFYPGNPQNIGGTHPIPIESMRLKLIRDGYEDYEYLKLLADRGQQAQALAVAHGLFPTMYTTAQSDATVQAARRQLAQLIAPIPPSYRIWLPFIVR